MQCPAFASYYSAQPLVLSSKPKSSHEKTRQLETPSEERSECAPTRRIRRPKFGQLVACVLRTKGHAVCVSTQIEVPCLKTLERCPIEEAAPFREENRGHGRFSAGGHSAVPLQGAEDELVAAASQLRLDDVKVARSFCKVFAARARAAEAHGARARRSASGGAARSVRCCPRRGASTTPRKRRRTPLKALENIQPTSGGKPRSARSPRSPAACVERQVGTTERDEVAAARHAAYPYVPPPPPPESPAVASPRRVRWSPVAPAAHPPRPEKAAVRRDLFSRDADVTTRFRRRRTRRSRCRRRRRPRRRAAAEANAAAERRRPTRRLCTRRRRA